MLSTARGCSTAIRRANRNTTARPALVGMHVKPSAAAQKVAGKSWRAVGRKGYNGISSEGVLGQNAETHRERVGPPTGNSGRSAVRAEPASARASAAAASPRRSRALARAGRCVGTASGDSRADRVPPRRRHLSGVAVEAAVVIAGRVAVAAAVVIAEGAAVAAAAGGDERQDRRMVQKDRRSARCRKQDRSRGCK